MNRFAKLTIYGTFFAACLYGLMANTSYAFIDKGTYTYIHNEAEYSIDLPDAPVGATVWADQKDKVPFLENPPKFGSIGEIARVRRVDIDTGDTYETEITFLKAERDFLLSMTEQRMKDELNNLYKDMNLDNKQETFSAGSDTLKWATLTGFTVDENNNLIALPVCVGVTCTADSYEQDNLCTEANWITENAAQAHSFCHPTDNTQEDIDWLKFTAFAGVTYTLGTNNASLHCRFGWLGAHRRNYYRWQGAGWRGCRHCSSPAYR